MDALRRLAGWLPAVILPVATLDQLLAIVRAGSSESVSAVTWALFLLANAGALVLGRPDSRLARVQMLLAFGLTAVLDAGILVVIWIHRGLPG